DEHGPGPDPLADLLPRHELARAFDEQGHHLERLLLERDPYPLAPELSRREVGVEGAEAHNGGGRSTRRGHERIVAAVSGIPHRQGRSGPEVAGAGREDLEGKWRPFPSGPAWPRLGPTQEAIMNHTSVAMLIGVAVLATACGDSPTSPDSFTPPDGTYRSVFSAVLGPGVGGLSVTPVPTAAGTFDAIFKVRVEKARPNTTYYVQRAPEVGRPNGADGVCQRALALSPWSAGDPPAAAFVTFPQPALPGGLASFTTQPNGNGSIDFEYG